MAELTRTAANDPPLSCAAVTPVGRVLVEEPEDSAADECWIRSSEPDTLPPDPFWFDGVLRKGLGRLSYAEQMDLARQYWVSRDDEHQRYIREQDHWLSFRQFYSDEPDQVEW